MDGIPRRGRRGVGGSGVQKFHFTSLQKMREREGRVGEERGQGEPERQGESITE